MGLPKSKTQFWTARRSQRPNWNSEFFERSDDSSSGALEIGPGSPEKHRAISHRADERIARLRRSLFVPRFRLVAITCPGSRTTRNDLPRIGNPGNARRFCAITTLDNTSCHIASGEIFRQKRHGSDGDEAEKHTHRR